MTDLERRILSFIKNHSYVTLGDIQAQFPDDGRARALVNLFMGGWISMDEKTGLFKQAKQLYTQQTLFDAATQ